jgi:hypothetical protein
MYQLQTLSLGNGEQGGQVHLTGYFIIGWFSRLTEFHHNNCGKSAGMYTAEGIRELCT